MISQIYERGEDFFVLILFLNLKHFPLLLWRTPHQQVCHFMHATASPSPTQRLSSWQRAPLPVQVIVFLSIAERQLRALICAPAPPLFTITTTKYPGESIPGRHDNRCKQLPWNLSQPSLTSTGSGELINT